MTNLLKHNSGFTMVEVMIVVLLMGITALLGLPMLSSSLDYYRLSGAAKEAVTAMQFAQATAVSSGRKTMVLLRPSTEMIVVKQYKTPVNLLSAAAELAEADVEAGGTFEIMNYPLKKGVEYKIDLTQEERFRGVDIQISDFNLSTPIIFDVLGRPSRGGSATFSFNEQQMVVSLDAITGKVTVN